MANNSNNYLDYAGLALFWQEAQKVINKSISDATGNVNPIALRDRIQTIRITYNGSQENIVTITQGTQNVGALAEIDMSAYAKKSDISAALTFKGQKTGTELAALTVAEVNNGDVYSCTEDGTGVGGTFKNGREYAAVITEVTPVTNPKTYELSWVELGGSIDLTGYVTTTDLNTAIATCATAAGLTALADRVSALETSVSNIAEIETEDILALFTEPEPEPEPEP